MIVDQLFKTGLAHHQAGRLAEAERCYRQILDASPAHNDALQLLGLIAHQTGHHAPAIRLISQAIAANPNVAAFHNNLAEAQRAHGDVDAALRSYRRALELNPNYAAAWRNLAAALVRQEQFDEAVKALSHAADLGEDVTPPRTDIASELAERFRFDEAIALLRAWLAEKPGELRLLVALGNTLHAAGSLDEALDCYNRVIASQPDMPEPYWNRALVRLTMGDYAGGWSDYEWRWRCAGFPYSRQNFPQPWWDGSPLNGKTILLDAEGGFGDVIQFVRYAKQVAACGGNVILGCPPELKELLSNAPGVSRILTRGDALPAFDVQLPLLSCPRIFGATLANLPAAVPYLAAPAVRVARFERIVPSTPGLLNIGLAWCGRPRPYSNRSCRLGDCEPLLSLPRVRFHSLQKDEGKDELDAMPEAIRPLDYSAALRDFADTAALIGRLDAVVSIDTGVVHLAGALGKPTLVMLPHSADWRWHRDRSDCPWYPTLRLFRQSVPGRWHDIIARVVEALRQQSQGIAAP